MQVRPNESGSLLNSSSASQKRTIDEVILLSDDDEDDTPAKKQKIGNDVKQGSSESNSNDQPEITILDVSNDHSIGYRLQKSVFPSSAAHSKRSRPESGENA